MLSSYPMAITPYYLSLIQKDDENDPIALQCIPDLKEISVLPNCAEDPLNEDGYMPAPKLIHRYPDRALAIVTKTCATYCRHCNRKRFWKTTETSTLKSRLDKMVRYVADSPQIREVILSGGDPLTYDDEKLEIILASFAAIPHVEVLRIGSRAPVVMPMRITKDLCRMLKRYRPLWFNTQFNHPAEITPDAARACNMLQEAGIPVSNQSVLLKGVNDSAGRYARSVIWTAEDIRPSLLSFSLRTGERLRSFPHGYFIRPGHDGRTSAVIAPDWRCRNMWRICRARREKSPYLALSESIKKIYEKHQDFFDFF